MSQTVRFDDRYGKGNIFLAILVFVQLNMLTSTFGDRACMKTVTHVVFELQQV